MFKTCVSDQAGHYTFFDLRWDILGHALEYLSFKEKYVQIKR